MVRRYRESAKALSYPKVKKQISDEERARRYEYSVLAEGLHIKSVFSVKHGDPIDHYWVKNTSLTMFIDRRLRIKVMDLWGNVFPKATERVVQLCAGQEITSKFIRGIGLYLRANAHRIITELEA